MVDFYRQAVMNELGGRVAIYAVGKAMDVANEMCKSFGSGYDDCGNKLKSPSDVFLEQYREEVERQKKSPDAKMMLSGATMYNLGGIYVIHSEKKLSEGLLVHEIFHVVNALSESCGIRDDEFSAHVGQYLFELFSESPVEVKSERVEDGLIQPIMF